MTPAAKNQPVFMPVRWSREQLEGMKTPSEWALLLVAPLPLYGEPINRDQERQTEEILEWHAEPETRINSAIGPRISRHRIDWLVSCGFLVWRGSDAEKEAIRAHYEPSPSPTPEERSMASQEAFV